MSDSDIGSASTGDEPRRPWTLKQKTAMVAGVGSWTLDAFDYFILVFVIPLVADGFDVSVETVLFATTITLIGRPFGALIFGSVAERYGRKPVLAGNIAFYSLVELATAFSPDLTTFMVLRAVYGLAMGGVWGIGSALTMESVPTRSRGWVSGVFQAGYPAGYLIASLVNYLAPSIGWRGMFAVGVTPILLAVFIVFAVSESPAWMEQRRNRQTESAGTTSGHESGSVAVILRSVRQHWKIVVFGIVLMTAFNFFSHGTQDVYPTFLKKQHDFGADVVSTIAIAYNIAAIIGGIIAGALSQRFGRRRLIVIFALLALPCIPLWAFASHSWWLGVGAFLVQFMVQGAWGVVPAYLNETMPAAARAVLPGFIYQFGNLIASGNGPIEGGLAKTFDGNYGLAMAIVAACASLVIAALALVVRTDDQRESKMNVTET